MDELLNHIINYISQNLKTTLVMTPHLDLLAGRSALSVIFKLLFDESNAEAKSQKHGPVSRGSSAEPAPETGGLKLSCQALQRGAVISVPRR